MLSCTSRGNPRLVTNALTLFSLLSLLRLYRSSPSLPLARLKLWLFQRESRQCDDVQRGADCAFRVVLVGNGRAEEGQDRVAHQAGDGALVLVDGCDEKLKSTVHDLEDMNRRRPNERFENSRLSL